MTEAAAGWINWRDVDIPSVLDVPYAKRPQGNQGTRKLRSIKDLLCAFDIETSKVPGYDQSVCYHWQMQMGFELPTVEGRTIEEYRLFLDRIAAVLRDDETLVVLVHNLSYEFAFLRSVYPEIRSKDLFAVGSRKVAKLTLYDGKIQFRCTLILTNLSLDAWTRQMGAEHQKLSGEQFDYEKLRMPWDPLTEYELDYCRNDVLGLIEAMRVQLDTNKDTLCSCPTTATGYVRRDVKRCMANWSWYGLQAVQPSLDVYRALRRAFRGGDTHCNRFYSGCVLENVGSADRSSSYPEVCINHEFPMGTFKREGEESERQLRRCIKLHRACLVQFDFENLRLKSEYEPCPYISMSKVFNIDRDGRNASLTDNGRLMRCPYGSLAMTDVDWMIFDKQYTWDSLTVTDLWTTRYDFLPDILRNLIISYYEAKTTLKGVEGQEVYYAKAKSLLNSIYGLQAQDPCKAKIAYNETCNPDLDLFYEKEVDVEAALKKYAAQPYGSYQWSCWITAWARWELRQVIDLAGTDQFVYCDTDSVYYVGDIDLTEYNRNKVRLSHANGAEATDPQGVTHYMGVFEEDPRKSFRCWGAKKYATIKRGKTYSRQLPSGRLIKTRTRDKLQITVAGVGKAAGRKELLEAAHKQNIGSLDAFAPGMVFVAGGGVEAVYNDYVNLDLEVDGHQLHVGPNIYLKPSTYKLGIDNDYDQVLQDAAFIRSLLHNTYVNKALSHTGTK